jgi:hypothetical protein
MTIELKTRQTFDDGDALEDSRELLSGPPQEVVEFLSVDCRRRKSGNLA